MLRNFLTARAPRAANKTSWPCCTTSLLSAAVRLARAAALGFSHA